MNSRFFVHAIGLVACCAIASRQASAHEEIFIGQDGSPRHRLGVLGGVGVLDETIALEPNVGGPLDGYFLADSPVYHSLTEDAPEEGLFRLLSGHRAGFLRVSFSPGLQVFSTTSFTPILTHDGDALEFFRQPDESFSGLLLSGMPPGTPIGAQATAVLRLVDLSGIHAESEDISVHFVTAPEPGAAVSLLLAICLMRRRRARL